MNTLICDCGASRPRGAYKKVRGYEGLWTRCENCNDSLYQPELSVRVNEEVKRDVEFLEDSDPSSESEKDDRIKDPAFHDASKRDPMAAKRALKLKKKKARASSKGKRRWQPGDPGYVYIMKKRTAGGEEQLKFGHTIDLERRRAQLQTGSAEKIYIYAYVWHHDNLFYETKLKKDYEFYNLRKELGGGTEFYDPIIIDELLYLLNFQLYDA